jgi:hypothetical protein
MAFQKQERRCASKAQGSKVAKHAQRVLALTKQDDGESRKALKNMRSLPCHGSKTNLNGWFEPSGKGLTARA